MALLRFGRPAAGAFAVLVFLTMAGVGFPQHLSPGAVPGLPPFRIPYYPPPGIDSGDFNGDGTSDIAAYRFSNGMWSVRNLTRVYFGSTVDIPVAR